MADVMEMETELRPPILTLLHQSWNMKTKF